MRKWCRIQQPLKNGCFANQILKGQEVFYTCQLKSEDFLVSFSICLVQYQETTFHVITNNQRESYWNVDSWGSAFESPLPRWFTRTLEFVTDSKRSNGQSVAGFKETLVSQPLLFRRPGAENCPLSLPMICEKIRWLKSISLDLLKWNKGKCKCEKNYTILITLELHILVNVGGLKTLKRYGLQEALLRGAASADQGMGQNFLQSERVALQWELSLGADLRHNKSALSPKLWSS